MMYFHTDNPVIVSNLAEALSYAASQEKRVRFDVDSFGNLKVKIGEGMWSAPIDSTPDPYRSPQVHPRSAGMTEHVTLGEAQHESHDLSQFGG